MIGLIIVIVAFAAYAIENTEDEPILVTGLEIDNVKSPGFYVLSEAQESHLRQHGYPNSFLILFYEETQPDGQRVLIREETWYYYESGYQITYHNGAIFNEYQQTSQSDSLSSTTYRPELFIHEMNMEEVLATAGQNNYLENPIEEELLENADLYFTKGLAFGIADGKLLYLETVP